jgi:hypothetical protein
MDDRANTILLLATTLKYSLREDSYLTTEEIASLIVEKRGPEDAAAIAHWIQENGHNEVEPN